MGFRVPFSGIWQSLFQIGVTEAKKNKGFLCSSYIRPTWRSNYKAKETVFAVPRVQMSSFQLPHVQADINSCKNTMMCSERGGVCCLNSALLQGSSRVRFCMSPGEPWGSRAVNRTELHQRQGWVQPTAASPGGLAPSPWGELKEWEETRRELWEGYGERNWVGSRRKEGNTLMGSCMD